MQLDEASVSQEQSRCFTYRAHNPLKKTTLRRRAKRHVENTVSDGQCKRLIPAEMVHKQRGNVPKSGPTTTVGLQACGGGGGGASRAAVNNTHYLRSPHRIHGTHV
ncbi:unnamed protein product, partial [Ectocarpus sp. 12 AP-2014]